MAGSLLGFPTSGQVGPSHRSLTVNFPLTSILSPRKRKGVFPTGRPVGPRGRKFRRATRREVRPGVSAAKIQSKSDIAWGYRMAVKIGFQASLGYRLWPAHEVVASLKSIGYEGVEWTTAHFDPAKTGADSPRNLIEMTRNEGLEPSRIMAHEDLVSLDEDERQSRIGRTLEVIEAAGECDVATVGTMTGPAPWDADAPRIPDDISEGAAWDQVLDAYTRFDAAARKAGVTISSEGVFGMVAHDFYSHRYLIDALDSPVQMVNFDPSHGILSGNLDVGWIIRQWGSAIVHCHLKDAVGISQRPGEFIFPMLGEGRVDWTAFFTALGEIGFEGYCAVEYESFGYLSSVLADDSEAAARVSMEQVRALMAGNGSRSADDF